MRVIGDVEGHSQSEHSEFSDEMENRRVAKESLADEQGTKVRWLMFK